jgi:hypothetical protein
MVRPERPILYTPYVHVFRHDGAPAGRRAPKNIFAENNLYTIERSTDAAIA